MVIPGVVAASWMVTTVANAALAQGLLGALRRELAAEPAHGGARPADLAYGGARAGGGGGDLPGAPRFVGLNITLALFVAFCLAGLAVLHAAVRRLSQPTMVLVFFYTMATMFGWPFLIVAVLGLLESWLGLRRRLALQGAHFDG